MVVVVVLLAGVLGAAVLAIVLLSRGYQRNRQHITELRAEVTAQKIAAMAKPGPRHAAAPPEPDRRKGHLALYIGGGIAAALASFGGRLRSAIRAHRAVTVAVASVAAAGTAAAITMAGGTGTAPIDEPARAPGRMAPAPPAEPESAPVAEEETDREHPAVLEPRRDPEEPDVLPFSAEGGETPTAPPPAPTVQPSTSPTPPPVASTPPASPAPAPSTTSRPDRCLRLPPVVEVCAPRGERQRAASVRPSSRPARHPSAPRDADKPHTSVEHRLS